MQITDRHACVIRLVRGCVAAAVVLCAGISQGQTTSTNGFGFDDFLLVPLRVHLLSAEPGSPLQTSFTEADLARILPKMNLVWSQAGVHFYVESLVKEPAALADQPPDNISIKKENRWLVAHIPAETHASNAFNIYYIKRFAANGIYFPQGIFVKDTASLHRVEGGIDEPLPRVTSHELGHALSLPHRQDTTNLMASGTTGTWLNESEIQSARTAAKKHRWIKPASEVLKQADQLQSESKADQARVLYARLATIPVAAEAVAKAAKQLKD